ncbi:MAG: DASS family sodium-coupled anion symporter [Candidatus Methanofastidiosa archaeon]|nr:DASS family sodium-coupled anion symporter [Candidatus Methanofastidiosa archaeon]
MQGLDSPGGLFKGFDFHRIGLILGIVAFAILLLVPSSSMDENSMDVIYPKLSAAIAGDISRDFGTITDDNFPQFMEYSKTINVAVSTSKASFISESEYDALSSKSSYKDPIPLYDVVRGQSKAQMKVLAIALLMAIWWITEALPVAVTALLPAVLLPVLGVCHYSNSSYPGYFPAFVEYSNYLIFLFLGGFVIAASMRKWGLDKRISLNILRIFGTKPSRIILGFMVATAFLSMWISNTATAALMMPVALAVLTQAEVIPEKSSFGLALMLSIAYAASIGGIGTLIGTPPNGIAVGFIAQYLGKDITFADWIKIGLPLVIIFLPIAWRYILWRSPPEIKEISGGRSVIKDNLQKLGKLSTGEKTTLFVFVFTALAWATRSSIQVGDFTILKGWSTWFGGYFSYVHDSTISVLAIVLLFLLPVGRGKFTMDWATANKYVPWGTLILFGGGLTLGKAIANTGLSSWIASYLTMFGDLDIFVLILVIAAMSALLSEVTSNTATTSMLMPVMFAMGMALNRDPMIFMITSAVATSLVFTLPVATPPNAIVFGTGYVSIDKMARVGILLDVIGMMVWSLIVYFIIGVFFGVVSV